MDRTARDLSLRVHTLVSSLRTQVQNAFGACLNLYSPETWLVLYYPLFYFSKVAKRNPQSTVKQGQGILSDLSSSSGNPQTSLYVSSSTIEKTALSIVIFGPLCYVFLLHYHLLDSGSWRTTSPAEKSSESEEDSFYHATNRAPESLLLTNVDTGLTEHQVSERQKRYGPNEVLTTRNWFYVLLRLALDATNLVAEAAALVAVVLRDWTEMAIICGLLAFNCFAAIRSIRQYDDIATTLVGDLSGFHYTRRGGAMVQVPMRELVPGDIVNIEQGQTIMVEGRVVTSDDHLSTDQSSITGQSTGVNKLNGDICYPGSGVVSGNATLIVVATGHHTFLGRTLATLENPMPQRAQPLYTRQPPHHVREYWGVLHSTGVTLSTLIIVALSVIWNFSHHIDLSYPILTLSLGLTILVVPISLTNLVESLRARGAERLSEQGALLQTKQSINAECLAGIDVFCSDKTGTLTANKLVLREPYCISCDVGDVILTACLSGSPDHEDLDPIDQAIFNKLDDYPQKKQLLENYKISAFVDFDPVAKRSWAWAESPDGRRTLCTKGAPKAVLNLCAATHEIVEEYKEMASKFARQGYRSLGVARKSENGEWELLGLLPIIDPPREDIMSTLKTAKTLGVMIKMLTGDAMVIAQENARMLGMGTNVVEAALCNDKNALSDPELSARVEAADGYAEVLPEHKEMIAQIHQRRGYRVAETGDGLEDAYSLKRADCGIAIEGSAEAAISASDIYMQIPGLAAMLRALQISRLNFRLVWAYITYRVTLSLHLTCVLLGHFAAYNEVLNLNLVLLNIHFSDIIGLALVFEDQHTPFPRKPARWSTRSLLTSVIPLSTILTIGTWMSLAAVLTEDDPVSLSATRRQVAFLHAILSDHLPFLISRVDSRLRAQVRDWRAIATILSIGVLATLSCIFGWVSEGQQMSVQVAIHVWLYSFATVCTAAGLRLFILDEELCEMA